MDNNHNIRNLIFKPETQKRRNGQAVHILLQLNSEITSFNTLYYKYLMYRRNLVDLLTSTNHSIYTVNTVLGSYKQITGYLFKHFKDSNKYLEKNHWGYNLDDQNHTDVLIVIKWV